MSTATAWTRSSPAPGPSAALTFVSLKVSGGAVTELASFLRLRPEVHGWCFRGVRRRDGRRRGGDHHRGGARRRAARARVQPGAGSVVTEVASFFAYDPAFTGGVHRGGRRIMTGDGVAEIITGAGPGGGPHVRAVEPRRAARSTEVASFFAYDAGVRGRRHRGGRRIVTGDGVAEIITGAGPGGGPHVRAFSLRGRHADRGCELLRL